MVFYFIIFERLFYDDVSYSLDIVYGHGLVRLYTSAVHLHSFRFAGGILTAGGAAFL
jgi:hypothetical protein